MDCKVADRRRFQTVALFVAASRGLTRLVRLLTRHHIRYCDIDCQLYGSGWSPLHVAARSGHLGAVDALLTAQAALDVRDKTGATPICLAVEKGHAGVVARLIRDQARLDLQAKASGATVVHVAASKKHHDVLRLLTRAQADMDHQLLDNNETAVFIATRLGDQPAIDALVQAGANVALRRRDGCTVLHLCAARNWPARVASLIGNACVDVNDSWESPDGDESFGTALHIAAEMGHEGVARLLVAALSNPDQHRKPDGATALYAAVTNERLELVRLLLAAQADPSLTSSDGASPIVWTAQYGLLDIARLLVDAGADVDQQLDDGSNGLQSAAQDGNLPMLELLLNAQAAPDVQETEDGCTALYFAAQSGHADVVEALTGRAMAMVDLCQTSNRATPLYIACQDGNASAVELLIRSAASVDQQLEDGCTPLYIASQNGHIAIVKALIAAGADVDLAQDNAASPLYVASQFGHSEVVAVLIAAGADLNARQRDGVTPACMASQEGKLDVVDRLVRAGADLNYPMLLHTAAQSNHVDIVKRLIAARVDVNLPMLDGGTPLYIAAQWGHTEVVRALLQAGASPDCQKLSGATPLFIACQQGYPAIVHLLLTAQADTEMARREDGSTPLYVCAMLGRMETATDLISRCADVNHPRRGGDSPMDAAVIAGMVDVQRLLSRSGALASDCEEAPYARVAAERLQFLDEAELRSAAQARSHAISHGEEFEFCADLHKAMLEAGFQPTRAIMQSAIAVVLEEILQRRYNSKIFTVGSFAEGWGNSLTCLAGITDPDSDIDVTQFTAGKLLHIRGFCRCVDPDMARVVEYTGGHILYKGSTGNPAKPNYGSALRPAVDFVTGYELCCYPTIEVLRPDRPTQIPRQVVESLRLVRDTMPCHVVTAAPSGMEGLQLRLSTTFFEKKLLQSLTAVQGQLFILLKYIVKRVLAQEVKGLKTYLVKTLIFRMLDLTPASEWQQPGNLMELARSALRMLRDDLKSSGPDKDDCMRHFFLVDAAVYLKRDHSGKEAIASAVGSVLQNLAQHLASFKSDLKQPGERFYFHPFQVLPALFTSAPKLESRLLDYHEIYDAVSSAIHSLASMTSQQEQHRSCQLGVDSLLDLLDRIPDSVRRARETLRVMLLLKQGDKAGALRALKSMFEEMPSCHHRVSRSIQCPDWLTGKLARTLVWQHLIETDSAWRYCFVLEAKLCFDFLPEFFRLFPLQLTNHRGMYYVNFDCLAKCLYLELVLPHSRSRGRGASLSRVWFKEASRGDAADQQEILMTLKYCRDVEVLMKLLTRYREYIMEAPISGDEFNIKQNLIEECENYCKDRVAEQCKDQFDSDS